MGFCLEPKHFIVYFEQNVKYAEKMGGRRAGAGGGV